MWHCCSARLWSSLSLGASSPLCKSSMQNRLFISGKCAAHQPSPWSWRCEWTARCKSSGVHFLSECRVPYSNWIWTPPPPSFSNYSFVCLPLTCCQLGNAQHPATLPPATSWCATVWVMPWINMLMYKGMSAGFAMRQFRWVWEDGSAQRGVAEQIFIPKIVLFVLKNGIYATAGNTCKYRDPVWMHFCSFNMLLWVLNTGWTSAFSGTANISSNISLLFRLFRNILRRVSEEPCRITWPVIPLLYGRIQLNLPALGTMCYSPRPCLRNIHSSSMVHAE